MSKIIKQMKSNWSLKALLQSNQSINDELFSKEFEKLNKLSKLSTTMTHETMSAKIFPLLHLFETIQEIQSLEGVEPMITPIEELHSVQDYQRADDSAESFNVGAETMISFAPSKTLGYFSIPKVSTEQLD